MTGFDFYSFVGGMVFGLVGLFGLALGAWWGVMLFELIIKFRGR